MEIIRVNSYTDTRFSKKVLQQHGCFLVDDMPYEIEIISDSEAIVRGENPAVYLDLIEEFRFYAPHITVFRDQSHTIIKAFPRAKFLSIPLEKIQPSQFFVDEDKIAAVSTFLCEPQDIVIQVTPRGAGYISLDGHTRLYYAVMKGWKYVRGVVDASPDYIDKFVEEANARGIFSPKDMKLVNHTEYKEKWDDFCEQFWSSFDTK